MSVVEAACLGEYSEGESKEDWGGCDLCGWSPLCWDCTFIIPQATIEVLPEYLSSIYPTVREIAKKRMEEIKRNESTNSTYR